MAKHKKQLTTDEILEQIYKQGLADILKIQSNVVSLIEIKQLEAEAEMKTAQDKLELIRSGGKK